MAAPQAVNKPPTRNLGFLNGLLTGLGLALGVWGWEAIKLLEVPVVLQYPSLIFAALLLIALFGLTGWLTGRWEKMTPVLFVWLVTAVLTTYLIAYQPTLGRTLTVWLADRRFWGLPIYPFTIDSPIAPILAGFFIILLLMLLAVLQNYRLELASSEVNENGRLQIRAWLMLLLPLPFVIVAGMITRDVVGDPSAQAVKLVHQAIQVSRTHEGDLFELGLQDGINYSALNSVRDQLSAHYTMGIGGVEPSAAITYIVVHFDNGAWVTCRIISETLSYCYDAAPPYTVGLTSFITGEEPPETCLGCLPQASQEWQTWLQSKNNAFNGPFQVQRVAQWANFVIMRAESDDYALECWFSDISPVQLDYCAEAAAH